MSPNILSDWKKNVLSKKLLIFDAVSISYAFITQFVNIINCINFPCKGWWLQFCYYKVSSTPTANEIHVRLWNCTVSTKFTVQKNLILSANRKYLLILNNNNSILIYCSSNLRMQMPITKLERNNYNKIMQLNKQKQHQKKTNKELDLLLKFCHKFDK